MLFRSWGGVYALTGMGGTHVVLRAVNAPDIYRLLRDEKVTFACMAPAVLRTLLDFPERDAYTLAVKPRITVAGAPPPAAFIERLETEMGWEFMQIYGLTETSPLLTVNRAPAEWDALDAAERSRRLSRAGVPAVGVRIRVDENGEILAKSNHVFAGYWNQPEETAKALDGGWFHTGDEIGRAHV